MAIAADQKSFTEVARERRSVRAYDPGFTLSKEEIKELLAEAILAPSSSNLQPWRFLVIHDAAQKEKLLPIANNQQQVVTASAVIAVLGDLDFYRRAETIYGRAAEAGYMPEDVKNNFVERISAGYSKLADETLSGIATLDSGLVSMQLMLAAKARGLDTVPMGDFNHEQLKAAFHLPERYKPMMLIAVGKAAVEGRPSVRLTVDEVAVWDDFAERN